MLSFQRQLLTPAGLAPPVLSRPQYAAVFDSDDEYETDDGSSITEVQNSFRRHHITPPTSTSGKKITPSKAVSLLAMQLKRYREAEAAAIDSDVSDWLSDDPEGECSNETNEIRNSRGEEAPASNQHCEQATVSEQVAPIVDEPAGNVPRSLDHGVEESNTQQPAITETTACFKGPQKSNFFAIVKKAIITGLKRCSSIALLRRKATKQDARQIEAAEETDPYILFFENGQDRDNVAKKQTSNNTAALTTASTKTGSTADEVDDPYNLFFGNNQDCGIPPEPALAQPKATTNLNNTAISPTPEQQERTSDEALTSFPPRTSWVNDHSQVPDAVPMNTKQGDVSYIARDKDWVCCGCCAMNSRYEFLCWCCRAHSKGRCCEEAVEEIDGVAGWGVGRLW